MGTTPSIFTVMPASRYAAFTSSWFSVPGGIAGHPAPGSVVDAVAADVILVGRPQDEARVPITSGMRVGCPACRLSQPAGNAREGALRIETGYSTQTRSV